MLDTEMLVTEWFPMNVEPVYVGAYQVKASPDHLWYSYWDGEYWRLTATSAQEAEGWFARKQKSRDCYSGRVTGWRGVMK